MNVNVFCCKENFQEYVTSSYVSYVNEVDMIKHTCCYISIISMKFIFHLDNTNIFRQFAMIPAPPAIIVTTAIILAN